MKIFVKNMESPRGNTVPNQFIISAHGCHYFQSYQSIIVKINSHNGKITLDKNTWDYSMTTGKYRNIFLGETKKETEEKIKSGVYKLANLNK